MSKVSSGNSSFSNSGQRQVVCSAGRRIKSLTPIPAQIAGPSGCAIPSHLQRRPINGAIALISNVDLFPFLVLASVHAGQVPHLIQVPPRWASWRSIALSLYLRQPTTLLLFFCFLFETSLAKACRSSYHSHSLPSCLQLSRSFQTSSARSTAPNPVAA